MVEGQTEKVFLPVLRGFVRQRLEAQQLPLPKLIPHLFDGRLPKHEKLRRTVETLLRNGPDPAEHVIALTDVYTGTDDFADASDAKQQMRTWVGPNDRFHPHAAQHDFEAWLLPYWARIQRLAKHNRTAPGGAPELVNHNRPPSYHIKEIFRIGQGPRDYTKTRDAKSILEGQDLIVAVQACPELRALVNTILTLSGGAAV